MDRRGMDRRSRVERKVVLQAPPPAVWAALTTAEELSRWFGLEVLTLELRPGGRIVFRDPEGQLRRAVIETVEAPVRFVFRWLPALVRGDSGAGRAPGSIVELVLEEVPDGTALSVVETPWVPLDEGSWTSGPVYTAGAVADPPGAPPRIMMLA